MEVVCPGCGMELEIPSGVKDGSHLQCPKCAMRFVVDNDEVVALESDRPRAIVCEDSVKQRRVGFWRAHGAQIAVVLGLLMGGWICFCMTISSMCIENLESKLYYKVFKDDQVWRIRLAVEDMQGDVMHMQEHSAKMQDSIDAMREHVKAIKDDDRIRNAVEDLQEEVKTIKSLTVNVSANAKKYID